MQASVSLTENQAHEGKVRGQKLARAHVSQVKIVAAS